MAPENTRGILCALWGNDLSYRAVGRKFRNNLVFSRPPRSVLGVHLQLCL